MIRTMFHRIRRVGNMPLFGTVVIPKDACVDPASFPDDEFPVYCISCGYQLRGVHDGNCSECGHPFVRGQLLVEQYVHRYNRAGFFKTRQGQLARRMIVAIFICATALIGGQIVATRVVAVAAARQDFTAATKMSNVLTAVFKWTSAVSLIIAITCALMVVIQLRFARRNRRAVINALRQSG